MIGFVKTNMDIKVMVLYALSQFHEPPNFEEISQVVLCDDGVNYFLLKQSVEELLLPENIKEEDGIYHITKRGLDNLKECQMPPSIQQKCDEGLEIVNRAQDKRKYVKSSVRKKLDGTAELHLSLSEAQGLLFETTMVIPTVAEAEEIAQSFQRDSVTFFYAFRDRAVALTAPPPAQLEKNKKTL